MRKLARCTPLLAGLLLLGSCAHGHESTAAGPEEVIVVNGERWGAFVCPGFSVPPDTIITVRAAGNPKYRLGDVTLVFSDGSIKQESRYQVLAIRPPGREATVRIRALDGAPSSFERPVRIGMRADDCGWSLRRAKIVERNRSDGSPPVVIGGHPVGSPNVSADLTGLSDFVIVTPFSD